jgi:putative chromate ion transporter
MTGIKDSQTVEPKPSLGELTRSFAHIGILSFGGPAGQISLMHRIVVEEKRWLDHERFMSALNYCMLLPGPEAQQLATYIGWLLHGKRGGIIAGMLFILPGLLCILALAFAYALYLDAHWLTASLAGLKAAVLAVIIQALINIGKKALTGSVHIAVAISAFLALFIFAVPFPIVVFVAGLIGVLTALRHRAVQYDIEQIEAAGAGRAGGGMQLKSVAKLTLIGLALWQLPLVLLFIPNVPSILPELQLFFSKMAVVTFGGAYAVLTYVAQVAVESKAWISAATMLDGLAFAEATPGPLVLVLPFISFLAGFDHAGGWPPFVVALSAGLITTWATFVPSFLLIFLGAPFVERLNAMPLAKSAMSMITAAVVGVIANLTLWFGIGILFGNLERVPLGFLPFGSLPLPEMARIDLFSLAIVIISFCLLYWLKRSVLFTLTFGLVVGFTKIAIVG